MLTADQKIRRAAKAIQRLHDDGFDVDLLVELAMSNRQRREKPAEEHAFVREMYAEALGLKPKSEARLRGERGMRGLKAYQRERA